MDRAATPHSQSHYLHQLVTPLGEDVLIPTDVHGEEAMSRGFSYKLRCFSEARHDIQPRELVGKRVTFDIAQEDGGVRYFNGYVKSLRPLGLTYGEQRMRYGLTVVSWLWLLDQVTDCRIFQERSIPDIVRTVCDEWRDLGKATIDVDSSRHPKQRFVVQYNETTYNFVARICRRAGIFWWISHENGAHTVHFCDDPMRVPALSPLGLVLRTGTTAHDHLSRWSRESRLGSGEVTEGTYNYLDPQPVTVTRPAPKTLTELPRAKSLRRYHYTGDYRTATDGADHAARSIARHSERHEIVQGTGTYRTLEPGHHFRITAEPAGGDFPDHGRLFTLVRVTFNAGNAAGGATYSTGFEAVPRGEAIYPSGEQPAIASLQTAVVTGHRAHTVYTDHHGKRLGRVKVQFHWDREGRHDADSSCWLRVMQNGASNGFAGFYALPRVGAEVVVAFENGNPDRPFVLGALPHPLNRPPYGDNPYRSGIRTQSFDANAGAAAGRWNELRFDDRKDAEEVYFQAERDYNGRIKHDASREVGNDATERIGNNLQITVSGSETRDVGRQVTITAGSSITLQVGGNTIELNGSGITIQGGAVTINGSPVSLN